MAPEMAAPVIELSGVHFSYGAQPVLEDIHLRVQPGEFVGIVGPNGGGKTTLLKVMLGLLRPQRGRVRLFGRDVERFQDWTRIGYVPQVATHFDPRFPATVEEVVAAGRFARAGLFKRLDRADRAAITAALEMVGLEGLRGRLIGRLSGGQQQRAFIARALAGQPELLILDEPTVGVDCEAQEAFYRLLRDLKRELALTLVMVSHDIGVVTEEVDEIACVNRRLVYHGDPRHFPSGEGLAELYGGPVRLLDHRH